jgi:hypothetical protein
MNDMQIINATEVRKNWSETCDMVARERPGFIKRTHDSYLMASFEDALMLLQAFKFNAVILPEKNGVTLSLNEIDLFEFAEDIESAKTLLARSILDYAEEYYLNFKLYSSAHNRAGHLPYVIKALLLGSEERIKEEMICQNGQS